MRVEGTAWTCASIDAVSADPSDQAHAEHGGALLVRVRASNAAPDAIRGAVRRLLGRLARGRADLLVHADPGQSGSLGDILRVWHALEDLRQEGLASALGIAHAGSRLLAALAAAGVRPSVNQIELHPYLLPLSLLSDCRDRGVAVHALTPLGPRLVASGDLALATEPVLSAIAKEHGAGELDVIGGWALSRCDGLLLPVAEARALSSDSARKLHATLLTEEIARIDALHCEWRDQRDASVLASLYWDGSPERTRITQADTSRLDYGLYKKCYVQISSSERTNRKASEFVWRWLFNLPATLQYKLNAPPPSPVAQRIGCELAGHGFATSHLSELGLGHLLPELEAAAAEAIARARADEQSGDRSTDYRHNSTIALAKQIAKNGIVREVADGYLGMRALADQFPPAMRVILARRTPAAEQQLWHIDVEDFCVLKTFLLLTDLDADTKGCLEYVDGSHPFGPLADDAATLFRTSWIRDPEPGCTHQVKNEVLLEHVHPSLVRRLGGPKGTVLFFDARGLHRGGHVLEGMRIHAVNTYHSPNPIHPWPLRLSPWNLMWAPFRWQTNLSLKRPYAGWPPGTAENFRTLWREVSELASRRLARVGLAR